MRANIVQVNCEQLEGATASHFFQNKVAQANESTESQSSAWADYKIEDLKFNPYNPRAEDKAETAERQQ